MDISLISDVETADVIIKDPLTMASTDLVFTLAGPEHDKRRQIEMGRARKVRRQVERTGKVQLGDPEDDRQDQIELLAACTLGWKGLTDKGAPVPFSPQAAMKLYATEGLGWLRDQLITALNERERFIKSSAPA